MTRKAGAGLIQRFFAFLDRHNLSDKSVGIAFSGGPDSTALAICASEATRANKLLPLLVYVDHRVRPDSGSDRAIVRQTAEVLGLELVGIDLILAASTSEGEMRTARYQALATVLAERSIEKVMTGHHSGDQAETLLLQLVRGAGPEGASGMAEIETMKIGLAPVSILELIRPFLGERREELRALVDQYGLTVVVDETNDLLDRSRNIVRHHVLPVVSQINENAVANLSRFTEILRDESDVMAALVEHELRTIVSGRTLDINLLKLQPIALQRRVVRSWVERSTGLVLTFDRTDALRYHLFYGQGRSVLELGEGWRVRKSGRQITLEQTK